MSAECPLCSADMTWECARECAPNGLYESHYRCPDHTCDVVEIRITGVDV